MSDVVVDVQFASNHDVPSASDIENWVVRALRAAASDLAGAAEVAVRVVDEDEMQALNREYRDRDQPTNVLSFAPMEQPAMPADAPRNLGDIVLCAPVVAAEAAAQQKCPEHHWAHLIVHGTLHLIGYDHIKPDDAATMEACEVRILSEHGIPDPYRVA